MGSKLEQTLQTIPFKGIDRYLRGTGNNPSSYYTLQNLDVINGNELAAIGGVTLENASNLPGVDSIKQISYLNTESGQKKLVLWCKPSFSSIPAPSTLLNSSNFAGTGTPSANTYNLTVQFSGMGSTSTMSSVGTVVPGSNGVVFTIPGTIPTYVSCINVYAKDAASPGVELPIWIGSASRRAGVFPATATFTNPDGAVYAPAAGASPFCTPTGNTTFLPTTGGNLVAGTTYYFGIAPWVTTSAYRATVSCGCAASVTRPGESPANIFAYTLPAGYTAVTVEFNGVLATYDGVNGYANNVLFMGTTPEDLLPVYTRTDGTVTSIARAGLGAGTLIKEVPYNSNQGIAPSVSQFAYAISGTDPSFVGAGWAQQNRFAGATSYGYWAINGTIEFVGIGCWILSTVPYSTSDAYQALPNVSGQDYRPVPTPATFVSNESAGTYQYIGIDKDHFDIQWTQVFNRIYAVNGFQTMWKMNGYIVSPVIRDYQTANIPITKCITAFQSKIILAGGASNAQNSAGQVYYTEPANDASFTVAPTAVPGINNLNLINTQDGDEILGLNIYSQNLLSSGPNTFLVIGKKSSVWTWSGIVSTPPTGAQQLQNRIGFAGPNCFARTQFGPVFVGQDNIYFMPDATSLRPFGDEVKSIIQSLTDAQRLLIKVLYQDNRVKIGYPTTTDLDREIWLFLEQGQGNINKYYSGPHIMKSYTDECFVKELGAFKNSRFSFLGGNIYVRDNTASYLNDTAAVARSIVINRLGLQADHFWKVLEKIYMSLEIAANTTFTFTLAFEEGTASFPTFTKSVLIASGARQFPQTLVPARALGRVVSCTIDFTNSEAISFFDISLTFQQLRRRLLS